MRDICESDLDASEKVVARPLATLGTVEVAQAGRLEPKNWMVRLFIGPLAKPMQKAAHGARGADCRRASKSSEIWACRHRRCCRDCHRPLRFLRFARQAS